MKLHLGGLQVCGNMRVQIFFTRKVVMNTLLRAELHLAAVEVRSHVSCLGEWCDDRLAKAMYIDASASYIKDAYNTSHCMCHAWNKLSVLWRQTICLSIIIPVIM